MKQITASRSCIVFQVRHAEEKWLERQAGARMSKPRDQCREKLMSRSRCDETSTTPNEDRSAHWTVTHFGAVLRHRSTRAKALSFDRNRDDNISTLKSSTSWLNHSQVEKRHTIPQSTVVTRIVSLFAILGMLHQTCFRSAGINLQSRLVAHIIGNSPNH